MEIELETTDFGACCSCGREGDDLNIKNVVMLEQKAPAPGSGWGCLVCNLPVDGAVAVICDDCLSLGRPIKFAVAGELKKKRRIPVEDLGAEHKHDMTKHGGPR